MARSTTWRSPYILPRPVDAASLAFPQEPRERLLLSVAWRSRAVGHGLAHALGRVPGGKPSRAVLAQVAHALAVSNAFTAVLAANGVPDAEILVEARLSEERLPRPESWAEAAVVETLAVRAGLLFAASLEGSRDGAVAAAARAAAGPPASAGAALLDELAADARNRPCLQLLVDRWMPDAIRALGRPGGPGEAALLGSGVTTRASADLAREFLAETTARLASLGLAVPDGQRMGVVLPDAENAR